jgi:hypothetical protein
MPTYRLVGGPCDGNTQFYYTPPPVGTVLPCGFHDYILGANGSFNDGGLSGSGGTVGPEVLGTHGPRAWADLQKAVNVSIPTGLSRAKGLTRAAHGKLMQRRRMR